MHRQQRGAQDHRQHQRNGAELKRRADARACQMGPQIGQRTAADFGPGQRGGDDQQAIGEAIGDPLLVGGQAGEGPFRVEAQQLLQRHADQRPGEDQQQPVIGQQHQMHRRQRAGQRRHIAPLAGFTLEIARRKSADHGAQQLHQQGHAQT